MEALAVLLIACFIACTIGVWLRTRAISLLLLISLLYNYVLHGYVVVFFHDVLGYSRENYWYDSAPYFVMLDRTYVEAMVVSLLFANASILLWLLLPNPGHSLRTQNDTELAIDGWPVLIAGIICFAVGVVPWVSALERFMSDGTSSYIGFKSGEELGAYSGLFKVMLIAAAMCLCLLAVASINGRATYDPNITTALLVLVCTLGDLWPIVSINVGFGRSGHIDWRRIRCLGARQFLSPEQIKSHLVVTGIPGSCCYDWRHPRNEGA